jgi:adenosylhomocysteine nucleosidase
MKTPLLVCFAVKEEAAPFRKQTTSGQVRTLVTGMGRNNTERAIRSELAATRPALVLTCGFAGGLNPKFKTGTVLFQTTSGNDLSAGLEKAGAVPARFHCAQCVATTAAEKRALRVSTQADAVEMESSYICAICAENSIPCATVRVVLDEAESDLPLDFNALMNSNQEMDFKKLAGALVCSPGKIPSLMRLQKESRSAAEKLAEFLIKFLRIVGDDVRSL